MSALLQGVPRRSGSAIYTLDGVAAPDHFANGLPYEADGALATAFGAVIDHWHQGLPFTAVGRLAIGSGTPEYFGSGHAPFNITGLLDGVNSPSVDHFASGVGYSAVGRFNYQNV